MRGGALRSRRPVLMSSAVAARVAHRDAHAGFSFASASRRTISLNARLARRSSEGPAHLAPGNRQKRRVHQPRPVVQR